MTTADTTDVIGVLTREHREVEDLFQRIEALSAVHADEVTSFAEQVVTNLVAHSVAEEAHLYPAVRQHVQGGDALADREVAEHDEVERTMKRLESQSPRGADFWLTFKILTNLVRQHVGEEERTLFPLLAAACSPEDLQRLGDEVTRTERTAPTRPHPSAPSEGAPLRAAALAAGLVDRARDLLSGRSR